MLPVFCVISRSLFGIPFLCYSSPYADYRTFRMSALQANHLRGNVADAMPEMQRLVLGSAAIFSICAAPLRRGAIARDAEKSPWPGR
jgi:hypothetical protein